MKIAAFDIGDRWIGIATCDPLEIVASPYHTIQAHELDHTIQELIESGISHFVVGLPKTLRGTDSQQTLKIKDQFDTLKKKFDTASWALWDERLTSKQADAIKRPKTKNDKLASHSIAAALILQSYLERRKFEKEQLENAN